MKKLTLRLTNTLILAAFALMQILPQGMAYAQERSTGDAVSERTFFERAAHWLKQTEYKKIREDAVHDRNATLNDTNFINGKTLAERPEAEVELQRMTSGGEDENAFNVFGAGANGAGRNEAFYDDESLEYDVAIGTGEKKEYDEGRLIAETINGVRHIYVGFNTVGTATIQEAVDTAGMGDRIIVRGGKDSQGNDITYSGFTIDGTLGVYKSGIKIYGGYREDGMRDPLGTPTIINGGIGLYSANGTEINGFKVVNDIYGGYGIFAKHSRNIMIKNNDITVGESAIYLEYSTGNVMYSKLSDSKYGIFVSNGAIAVTQNNISNVEYGIKAVNSILTATNNNISGSQRGIDISGRTLTATNNDITGGNIGIAAYSTVLTVTNNNITGGGRSGISVNSYSTLTATNNNISGGEYGISTFYLYPTGSSTATNNNISGGRWGIYVMYSTLTAKNNTIDSGQAGIYAYASTLTAINNNISGIISAVYGSHFTATNNNIGGIYSGNHAFVTATNNNISGKILANYSSRITATNNNISGDANRIVGIRNGSVIASGNYFRGTIYGNVYITDSKAELYGYDIEVDIPDVTGNEMELTTGIRSIITPLPQGPTPIIFRRGRRPRDIFKSLTVDLSPSLFSNTKHRIGPTSPYGASTLDIDLQEGSLRPDFDFTGDVIIKTEGELTKSAQDSFASNMPVDMFNQRTLSEDYALENIVTDLENKQNKTATEESLLAVAKAVMEEAEYIEYLEGDMLEEFKSELWRVLRASSEEDNLKMEGVDFTLITGALTKLAEEEVMKYDAYLIDRNTVYERIEALLMHIDKEKLPDNFLVIAKGDTRERRKLEMDHKLSLLTEEDLALLTKEERDEFATARSALPALRNDYIENLRERISAVITVVQNTLGNAVPYAISTDELTNTTEASLTLDERVREKKQ